jgi:eukaryotic-like serine/threonine-protein kinase
MNEQDIFIAALEINDPEARKDFLQSACANNADLLCRVKSLLASDQSKSQFLETPAVEQLEQGRRQGADATICVGNGSTQEKSSDVAPESRGNGPMPRDQDDQADETALGYLQPSTQPGSLGRLAHYEILEFLGSGAFGTVLKAFDNKLQRVVAIKVMAPELAATSPARKRFLREARASAAIRHENVVSVYAVEETPIPYLVMEYVPGQTLQQRLDETGPLEVPNALRLGGQIAEGLAAAHAKDLIHRDIKPGNILLESGIPDRVKITDFGLARAADDASMTQSGVIAGTPMYMAPEQALGNKLDQRADLFSFGSVLYQMVSGRPPFRAATTLAVLKRVTEETPRPISEIIPETPVWLCNIISRLHAKNPNDRYQSAREIADELAKREARLKAHGGLGDHPLIPSAKRPSASWWRWVAVVLAVLPFVAYGVYALSHWRKTPNVQADATATSGWPADAPPLAVAPFGTEKAKELQVEWAKYLNVPVETTNSIGMKLLLIPPGEFEMGSPKKLIQEELKSADGWYTKYLTNEGPAHRVRITKPHWLGTTDVTQEEYERVMGGNPSNFQGDSQRPVEQVSWEEAVEFCRRLSDLPEERAARRQYRLPTEAQFEYACRSGSNTRFWFGDDEGLLEECAWFKENSENETHPVGEKKPNAWGLYDMSGNVWQWCQDWYDKGYYARSPTDDPAGPSQGSSRVCRGTGWFFDAAYCRSAFRRSNLPETRAGDLGFRVVLVPAEK